MKILVRIALIFSFGLLTYGFTLQAQNTTTTNSNGTNWNDPNNWDFGVPDANGTRYNAVVNHNMTVQSGDDLTVSTILIADNPSATLTIEGILRVEEGTSGVPFPFIQATPDLASYGTLEVQNGGSLIVKDATQFLVSPATTFVRSNSFFEVVLNTSNLNFLDATWDATSTCTISDGSGITLFPIPTIGLNQNYGNFIWNCPNQVFNHSLGGALTSVAGNLTFQDSGGSVIFLTTSGNANIIIGEDFDILGSANLAMNNGTGTVTISAKNFTLNSK